MMTLSIFDTVLASLFIIIAIAISSYLRLGLSKEFLISAIRSVVQLSFVGLILAWVFSRSEWYFILGILSIMTIIASYSAMGRTKYPYKGLFFDTILALSIGAMSITFITIIFILKSDWHTPKVVIPILGMILGNTLTAISLTMAELINHLHHNQAKINAFLALSASPKEALADAIKSSIKNGMTPTINSLMVVGLVSLPGMMTGQILAGSSPVQAVRYQIVILFAICASGLVACTLSALLIVRRFFDIQWRLTIPPKQESLLKFLKK